MSSCKCFQKQASRTREDTSFYHEWTNPHLPPQLRASQSWDPPSRERLAILNAIENLAQVNCGRGVGKHNKPHLPKGGLSLENVCTNSVMTCHEWVHASVFKNQQSRTREDTSFYHEWANPHLPPQLRAPQSWDPLTSVRWTSGERTYRRTGFLSPFRTADFPNLFSCFLTSISSYRSWLCFMSPSRTLHLLFSALSERLIHSSNLPNSRLVRSSAAWFSSLLTHPRVATTPLALNHRRFFKSSDSCPSLHQIPCKTPSKVTLKLSIHCKAQPVLLWDKPMAYLGYSTVMSTHSVTKPPLCLLHLKGTPKAAITAKANTVASLPDFPEPITSKSSAQRSISIGLRGPNTASTPHWFSTTSMAWMPLRKSLRDSHRRPSRQTALCKPKSPARLFCTWIYDGPLRNPPPMTIRLLYGTCTPPAKLSSLSAPAPDPLVGFDTMSGVVYDSLLPGRLILHQDCQRCHRPMAPKLLHELLLTHLNHEALGNFLLQVLPQVLFTQLGRRIVIFLPRKVLPSLTFQRPLDMLLKNRQGPWELTQDTYRQAQLRLLQEAVVCILCTPQHLRKQLQKERLSLGDPHGSSAKAKFICHTPPNLLQELLIPDQCEGISTSCHSEGCLLKPPPRRQNTLCTIPDPPPQLSPLLPHGEDRLISLPPPGRVETSSIIWLHLSKNNFSAFLNGGPLGPTSSFLRDAWKTSRSGLWTSLEELTCRKSRQLLLPPNCKARAAMLLPPQWHKLNTILLANPGNTTTARCTNLLHQTVEAQAA